MHNTVIFIINNIISDNPPNLKLKIYKMLLTIRLAQMKLNGFT
jgi:hypothetical protein